MKYGGASSSDPLPPDEPVTPPVSLEAALGGVTDVVARIAALLRDDAADVTEKDVDIADLAARSLSALSSALSAAGALVESRATHAEWEARFGPQGRAERADTLRAELADDVDRGTVRWFESWFDAMVAGATDEAWSVLRMHVELAPWAAWLPDRAAALQMSVEYAPASPESAAALLGGLVGMLIHDERAGADPDHVFGRLQTHGRDPVRTRVLLLVIASRVLALVGDPTSDRLTEQARQLVGYAHAESQASLNRAVVTTESFLARHGVGTHRAVRSAAARGAVADLFAIHEYIELKKAESSRSDGADPGPTLRDVQSLVDGLRSVAGGAERLDMLFEQPSPQLVLALATRLVGEHEFERADMLLGRLDGAQLQPDLLLAASDLSVRIAEASHSSPDELAGELVAAGDRALWSSMSQEAREYYERALTLRPSDAAAMRGLADALQLGSWREKDRAAAVRDLERALELTLKAAQVSPVTLDDAWAHSLARAVYLQLSRFAPRPHAEHPWLALRETAAAIRLGDATEPRWVALVSDLLNAGLMHTAAFAADRLDPDSPEGVRSLIYVALNTGRPAVALELLDRITPLPGDDPGWFEALRGVAFGSLDRIDEADEWFARAREAGEALEYPNWAAEMHTRHDHPAGALWSEVWKRSDLDDALQSMYASWAAIYQGALVSAREIADRLAPGCELLMGPRSGDMALAIVDILDAHPERGWGVLEGRFARILVPAELELNRLFARGMLRHQNRPDEAELLRRLDAITDTARARLRPPVAGESAAALMRWEWERTTDAVPAGVVAEVLEVLGEILPEDAPGPAEPAGDAASDRRADAAAQPAEADVEPGARMIRILMAPEWFEEFANPSGDEWFFERGTLLAGASLVRAGRAYTASRPIQVEVEEELDRHAIAVALIDGMGMISGVTSWAEWFAPESWAGSLRPGRILPGASSIPGLVRVTPPADAMDRVSSWSGAETIARLVYSIAAVDDEGLDDQWNAQRS